MTDRVRAVLITPDGNLLTIQRIRPGHDRYWVLPGGGVEVGDDRLDAIPLTAQALAAIDLKPDAFAEFLLDHLRAGTDVFTLPALRASLDVHPESAALRRP